MDIKKEILKRFTNNRFSFNDYLSASSYFKKEEHSGELKSYMKGDWDETEYTGDKKERLSQLLDRLHHQINLKQTLKPGTYQSFYQIVSKIAVVLLIPALITIAVLSYFAINNIPGTESYAEIHAPKGKKAKFQLPDGTEGWLNSGSSIKYPVSFSERNVEVSGEAWFEVVHQKSKEFRVITPYFDVQVLGTRFNVVAYEDENTAQVILEQGKVAIMDENHQTKAELAPNQQIIYNKSTHELFKETIDAENYTSWKDGVLIFKNEPMEEIAKRLERNFSAEIILHGDSLKTSVFRATFRNESLDEICRMLSEVAPIQYKIHKQEKQANDEFTKRKVEMWLK